MRTPEQALRRRTAFWIGAALVVVGATLHLPDYLGSAGMHYRMAGMDMGTEMVAGMVLIACGLGLAVWGMIPADRPRTRHNVTARFVALDRAHLGRAHRVLALVLTIGLVIDMMKPASLGFVAPGMVTEYGLTTSQISLLPLVAISGTVAGSLIWGYLADLWGRRSTILFSALMYVATAICGFMPSFAWNLAMCFAMGLAAGGMLPIVYSLMSESVPARQRGWLLVLQAGVGAALGYLVASGAAALLVPHLSWRILWLLGAPTGVLLVVLSRWIPESPRYLLATGRDREAVEVMERFGVRAVEDSAPVAPAIESDAPRGLLALRAPLFRIRTLGILLYGLSWGIVNWGFITFLPIFLGGDRAGAASLLFLSALIALPATALAAVLYARWSSRRTMLAYALATAIVLLLFAPVGPQPILLAVLLTSAGGMIALLSPYAAEIYPTSMRATAGGFAAAAGKAGGLFGPLLLTSAPGIGALALVAAGPILIAAGFLWRTGIETSGRPLVEVTGTAE